MPLQGAVAKAETLILEHLQLPGWRLCPCRLSTVSVLKKILVIKADFDLEQHCEFFTLRTYFVRFPSQHQERNYQYQVRFWRASCAYRQLPCSIPSKIKKRDTKIFTNYLSC